MDGNPQTHPCVLDLGNPCRDDVTLVNSAVPRLKLVAMQTIKKK
jgi:hypothetical protein